MAEDLTVPVEPLILASRSPRRKALLESAGLAFQIRVPEVSEPEPGTCSSPQEHVVEAAWRKARSVSAEIEQGTVLAADTITACSGLILGKPADRADARRTLELLSGTRHDVLTAVCVWLLPQRLWLGGLAKATVQMRRLSAEEIEQYLESGQWEGKAGAYAIQEQDPFVSLVDGDFDTVVGLPMKLVARLLQAARALAAAK